MSQKDLLKKVRHLLEEARTEEAVALAGSRSTKEIRDVSLHLGWADVLEELDLVDELIFELNLAIRDDPASEATIRRLSEVYIDQGDTTRAARCLWGLVKLNPDKSEHYIEIGTVLEEAGEREKALKLYRAAHEKTGDDLFLRLIRSLGSENTRQDPDRDIEKGDQIVPDKNSLVTFTTLFAGREGVYARQWVSPTGNSGYTPVHEPFILKTAENHILGNITAGIYPVRMDNTVNFIAVDLDLPKFVVNKAIRSESLWKKAITRVHKVAGDIIDIGAAHSIPVYLEDSGFKGRHCWVFLDTPVPAKAAKKFGEILVGMLKKPDPDVSLEVFPKQGIVKSGNLGNLIKLPLGYHKKTGKRSVFLNPDGTRPPNQLGFLEKVSKVSRDNIFGIVRRFQAPLEIKPSKNVPEPVDSGRDLHPDFHVEPAEPYDPIADEAFLYLLKKCPVLCRIIAKIEKESLVTKKETLVITHTLGYLEHGADLVNYLFRMCVNADPKLFLKSRLKGNPVSCPKIRVHVPEITSTVACNCTFDKSINMYPTPVNHLRSMPEEKPVSNDGSDYLDNTLIEYVLLKKKVMEFESKLKKCETKVMRFLENMDDGVKRHVMEKLKQMGEADLYEKLPWKA